MVGWWLMLATGVLWVCVHVHKRSGSSVCVCIPESYCDVWFYNFRLWTRCYWHMQTLFEEISRNTQADKKQWVVFTSSVTHNYCTQAIPQKRWQRMFYNFLFYTQEKKNFKKLLCWHCCPLYNCPRAVVHLTSNLDSFKIKIEINIIVVLYFLQFFLIIKIHLSRVKSLESLKHLWM